MIITGHASLGHTEEEEKKNGQVAAALGAGRANGGAGRGGYGSGWYAAEVMGLRRSQWLFSGRQWQWQGASWRLQGHVDA